MPAITLTTETKVADTGAEPLVFIAQDRLFPDYGLKLSKSTLRRMIEAGLWPRPVKFGSGVNCKNFYPRLEVENAIRERVRASRQR